MLKALTFKSIHYVTTIMSLRTEPCFLTLNHHAWFTVIGRIKIEGIADSVYKNALVEFEEGDSELSPCRCFYSLSGATSSKAVASQR